jgi:ribosomal protein S8
MPTEQQSWLDRYNTYHAATEYNRQHYGKRIKQLKRMLEDENFLEFLSNKDCKEDALLYLAKSNEFDMYITFNEQGEPYIHDHDFGLINHMKKMLRVLQSENFIKNSPVRPQAKRYVEMYLWYDREAVVDDPGELPF